MTRLYVSYDVRLGGGTREARTVAAHIEGPNGSGRAARVEGLGAPARDAAPARRHPVTVEWSSPRRVTLHTPEEVVIG